MAAGWRGAAATGTVARMASSAVKKRPRSKVLTEDPTPTMFLALDVLAGGVLMTPLTAWLPGYASPQQVLVPATMALATVFERGADPDTATPVDVFPNSDGSGAPLEQPLTTDPDGHLPGYLGQPAALDLYITGPGLAPRTVKLGFDEFLSSVPSVNGQTGPVILSAADVDAIAVDGSNMPDFVEITYTPQNDSTKDTPAIAAMIAAGLPIVSGPGTVRFNSTWAPINGTRLDLSRSEVIYESTTLDGTAIQILGAESAQQRLLADAHPGDWALSITQTFIDTLLDGDWIRIGSQGQYDISSAARSGLDQEIGCQTQVLLPVGMTLLSAVNPGDTSFTIANVGDDYNPGIPNVGQITVGGETVTFISWARGTTSGTFKVAISGSFAGTHAIGAAVSSPTNVLWLKTPVEGGPYCIGLGPTGGSTTLSGAVPLSSSDPNYLVVPLTVATALRAPSGTVLIDAEEITFSGIDYVNSKLTGVARAQNGTVAAAHISGAAVTQIDCGFASSITHVTDVKITVGDISATDPTLTQTLFMGQLARDCMVERRGAGRLNGWAYAAVRWKDAIACHTEGMRIQGEKSPISTHYGHVFENACQDCTVDHAWGTDVRHLVTTGGARTHSGIVRRLTITNSVCFRATDCAFDTHAGCEDVLYDNCTAFAPIASGFQVRNGKTRIKNGLVKWPGVSGVSVSNQTAEETRWDFDVEVTGAGGYAIEMFSQFGVVTNLYGPSAPPAAQAQIGAADNSFYLTTDPGLTLSGTLVLDSADNSETVTYTGFNRTTLQVTGVVRGQANTAAIIHQPNVQVAQGALGSGSDTRTIKIDLRADACASGGLYVHSNDTWFFTGGNVKAIVNNCRTAVELVQCQGWTIEVTATNVGAARYGLQLVNCKQCVLTGGTFSSTSGAARAISITGGSTDILTGPFIASGFTYGIYADQTAGPCIFGIHDSSACTSGDSLSGGPHTFAVNSNDTRLFNEIELERDSPLTSHVDRGTITQSFSMTSGSVYGCRAVCGPGPTAMANVCLLTGTSTPSTLTDVRVAIEDNLGNTLASTGNIASSLLLANTMYTLPLSNTTPFVSPFTPVAGGTYWLKVGGVFTTLSLRGSGGTAIDAHVFGRAPQLTKSASGYTAGNNLPALGSSAPANRPWLALTT